MIPFGPYTFDEVNEFIPSQHKGCDNEIYSQRKSETPKIFINKLFSSMSTLTVVTLNVKME